MDLGITLRDVDISTDVLKCEPDTTVETVRSILKDSASGCMVVVEGECVVGIFTERDYLFKVSGIESIANDEPISNYMTHDPKCLGMDDSLVDALNLMKEKGFRHIIVTEKNKKLVGILSVKDMLSHMMGTIDYLESCLKALGSSLSG